MNIFSSSTKGGSYDDIPGPAFTKDEKGRPKLTDAFANELRESVRDLQTNKTIKRKKFGFFGLRNRGNIDPIKQTPEKPTSTPSSRKRQLKVNPDDMNTGFPSSPSLLGANARHPSSPKASIPAKESPVKSSPKSNSPNNPRHAKRGNLSSAQNGKKIITKEEADELRKSFHNEMVRQDGHKVRQSEPGPTLKKRPTLSKEMTEELHTSFRKRHGTQGQVHGTDGDRSTNEIETTNIRQRPSLNKEITNELQMSFRKRQRQQGQVEPYNYGQRPSLSKDLADELQQSFAYRKSQKLQKRKELVSRIMKRRESKRALLSTEHGATEDQEESQPTFPSDSPKTKLRQLGSEMNDSIDSFASFASGPMGALVENDAVAPRETTPNVNDRPPSWEALQKQLDETKAQRKSLDRRLSRHKKTLKKNVRDTPQLKLSFHEDSPLTRKWSKDESETESNPVYSPFAKPTGEQRINHFNEVNQLSSTNFDGIDEEVQGDFDVYKKEWARLIKEKRSLKNKLSTSRAHASLVSQQVDDLIAENKELRKQVNSWQEKATKLGKLQDKERIKFDNSTDLIAQARVELTRTLNETSKMKAKIFDLESIVTTKTRRIEDLHDTIERQTEMIDDLNSKYRDKETELRFTEDEKRKVEDELAVLISSRDGDDIGDTLRELEKEREQWLWQREQALEEKRKELEKENDQVLEREKQRHRQEMEKLSEDSDKTKVIEEEQQKLQEFINQQLKHMKDANQELQTKLTRERLDSTAEIKKQDHSIAMLEQEVLNLKKELARRDRSEKEIKFRKAEVESTKDDLRDAQKQNKLLEKEIENLKQKVEDLREQAHSWREIVLPGYKNMRGVTFGSHNSDSLTGFLTILVEEQTKMATGRTKSSRLEETLGNNESKTKHRLRSNEKKPREKIKASKAKS